MLLLLLLFCHPVSWTPRLNLAEGCKLLNRANLVSLSIILSIIFPLIIPPSILDGTSIFAHCSVMMQWGVRMYLLLLCHVLGVASSGSNNPEPPRPEITASLRPQRSLLTLTRCQPRMKCQTFVLSGNRTRFSRVAGERTHLHATSAPKDTK